MSSPQQALRPPVRPNRVDTDDTCEVVAPAAEEKMEETNGQRIATSAEEEGDNEVIEPEPHKVAVDPKLPSEAEVEEHRIAGHVDYRNWCAHCLAARGLGSDHTESYGSRETRTQLGLILHNRYRC